jgi:hypothetical protein
MVLAPFVPIGRLPAAAAEPYTLDTTASYAVQVDDRAIAVSIQATFTNLTPDPKGAFSVFTEVPMAIHDAATGVTATDGDGKLDVAVKMQKGGDGKPVNVATVELREPLRLDKTAEFTLAYTLPDGKDPGVRVRPSVVIFPAWSFGTSSEVAVQLPSVYQVSSDGDPLTASTSGVTTTLSSGKIADPQHWLAVVTADRQTAMLTVSQSVPLDGGTVDLNVRSWADDKAWGDRTLALLAEALPRLQERIGLPYAGVGPLQVTEALPSGSGSIGEVSTGVQELQIGFDQPPFTVLHQAAHIWIGSQLAADRWIREGLASHYAALVAADLKVARPYDPAAQATAQQDNALALEAWTADSSAAQDAYGYPASWAFVDRVAGKVGEDRLQAVVERVSEGIGAYDPQGPAAKAAPTGLNVTPLDSRSLLDQLQAVSGQDLGADFGATVFADASDALLSQRAAALTAYAELLNAAGDWGAPRPVRSAMTGWSFDEATRQIESARAWLADRDDLLRAIERAGLSSPDRLRDPYDSSGGGTDAQVELQAERAVVTDYQAVLDQANAGRSFIERIGLLGGKTPDELLATAHGRFADGDLRGTADATSQARLRLDAAQTSGLLRLASAAVVVLVALALIVYLLRRRRTLARNVD